ncbi:MAG: DUF2779 domain-containing protein [Bacilli bacterium]|nr:DUF2779 domain-containing protein [Bacilli bacterium]
MRVSTSELLNYVRCYRYAALDKNNRVLSARKELNHYSSGDDSVNDIDVFPYSSESVESDAKKRLKYREFKEYLDLVYGKILSTGDLAEVGEAYNYSFTQDIELYAKPDYVVKSDNKIQVYLGYRATKKRLLETRFIMKDQKKPFFYRDKSGIYRFVTKDQIGHDHKDYNQHLKKLSARHEESGRILYDAAFHLYTMRRANAAKKFTIFAALLDSDYVQTGNKPDPELVSLFDVTMLVESLQTEIETQIYRMINHIELNDDSRCQLVKEECQRGSSFECPFVPFCFAHVPENNSVFDYFQQHLGFREGPHRTDALHSTYDLVNEGIVDMLDLPISWLHRESNLMQRYCVENDYLYLNKEKIKDKLATLIYPLYFLDFESYPSMLPRYLGERPYTQSLFQFSVHVKASPDTPLDELEHHEFLSSDAADRRNELLDRLLEAIPEGDSSIVVYNMTFEDNRLKELSQLFPEKATRIDNLRERLFDLLKVLKNDYKFYLGLGYAKSEAQNYNFYHPSLSGSYSLKKVLPVFASDLYKDLKIQNGTMAYVTYMSMLQLDEEQRQVAYKDLLAYCRQDTLSMAIILDELAKMVNK